MGQCLRCLTGTYQGSTATSRTLNFGVVPKAVVIVSSNEAVPRFTVLIHGQAKAGMADAGNEDYGATLSWNGTKLTFSAMSSGSFYFNMVDRTYRYFVIY